MEFIPLGKNIAIEFLDKEEEATPILLPTDYRPADAPYEVVRVASDSCGYSCEVEWQQGDLLVVEAHMIRQFDYDDNVHYVIAENHVIGWFTAKTTD